MEATRVTDYAIRALLYLSIKREPVRTIEISEAMAIPKAYLSKVLQELGRRGIVRLKAGVGGGVELLIDPAELTVMDVIKAIEGRFALNRCVYAPGECKLSQHCPMHDFWVKATDVYIEQIGNITFQRLVEDYYKKQAASSENEQSALANDAI